MPRQVMLKQLTQSDQKKLAAIYRQYRSEFIAWMTSHYPVGEDVARDIYQNTFITMSAKLQNGEIDKLQCSTKTYLFGIAKNKYREYVRRNGRAEKIHESIEQKIDSSPSEQQNRDLQIMLNKALDCLGEPCRSVLELYYFHGLSMDEIQSHFRYKNNGTAKNMKYKCLVRLRRIFQEDCKRKGVLNNKVNRQ
ncbi:MAG: sigma-70 family RNA polymerase sigma factor [Saprospiraceae bacterium]|nr:sigma-70 family RNA polymerase sigma factor [Saprospiraceae bacterium]